MPLHYDFLNMMRNRVGSEGAAPEELQALADRLEEARQALASRRADASVGFFDVPKSRPSRREMRGVLERFDSAVDTLVVIGIGGSNLGAQAVIKALEGLKNGHRGRKLRILWAGDNTDPQAVADLLEKIDWKKTALNVISKSGDTIEPMSVFVLLRDRMRRALGADKTAMRIIATTDAKKGTLRQIADEDGYVTLPVPDNVGGRFSVFTEVGMFPALAAGVDIDGLWRGAEREDAAFWKTPVMRNVPLLYAGLQFLGCRKGKTISVMMSYAERLALVGTWYRQLWAESLGKKTDRRKKTVHVGPTPVAAIGPADQHSQIQLYNEGPYDKLITFVEVDAFFEDFRLPDPFPHLEGVSYFAGFSFKDIVHHERQAAAEVLAENRRPNGTLHLSDLSAESVGGLLQALMTSAAVMGELLDINAFDQPGVEAGKQAMYRLMGRKGY